MENYDLVISGRIPDYGKLVEGNICITDGLIVDIKRSRPAPGQYGEIHRLDRSIIIPGAIDLHTHMRDPGLTRKEDFSTGTASAAFGGVTTIVDMPNTIPPTMDDASFLSKKKIAMERSYVDFGLNLVILDGMGPGSEFNSLLDPALAGFKAFLGQSTGSLVLKDISQICKWKDILRKTGKPLSVHAESGALLSNEPTGRRDLLRSHMESRPPEAEEHAVLSLMGEMGDDMRSVHLLHISSAKGLQAAMRSRATIEVTPHHLLLDIKSAGEHLERESMGKVNPPLRTPSDRAKLWEALAGGAIHTVGSDHAPHLIKEKESDQPPSGIPGVETMLPLLLSQVKSGRLGIHRLIEISSVNPAKRAGLERKGSIRKGKLADLVVIDMESERKVSADDLHSKCGWTPFEGMKGIFPEKVFSRGVLLIENENICVGQGSGKPMHQ